MPAGTSMHCANSPTGGPLSGHSFPAVSNWRPPAWRQRVLRHQHQRGHAGQPDLVPLQPHGVLDRVLHGMFRRLSALHSAMNALQCGDCDQALVGSVTYLGSARMGSSFNLMGSSARRQVPLLRRPGRRLHAFRRRFRLRAEAARGGGARRGPHSCRDRGERGQRGRLGGRRSRSAPRPPHHRPDSTRTGRTDAHRSRRAGRTAREFDYVEAHATGTVVGDRIEGNAIAEAFSGFDREVPLRVSSVKSNVGHMEAAAFHCAMLKVV